MKQEHKDSIKDLMAKSFLLSKREMVLVSKFNKAMISDRELNENWIAALNNLANKYRTNITDKK